MTAIFTALLYRPILNLTVLLYGTIGLGDLGLAIIIMTLGIRLALAPLSVRAARSQRDLARLAPEIEAVKEKHKGDNTAQSEAVMKLYREKGINPLGGCLPLLIQLPVIFGMYRVFLNIFKTENLTLLYSFVPHPATINHLFLGVMDISMPSHIFALAAGLLQFFQVKLSTPALATGHAGQPMAGMNKQMMYLFPVMIIVISWNFPAGLALYWITTTLFSIGEQLYLRRR